MIPRPGSDYYASDADMAEYYGTEEDLAREHCRRWGHDFAPAAHSESGEPVLGRKCLNCGAPDQSPAQGDRNGR